MSDTPTRITSALLKAERGRVQDNLFWKLYFARLDLLFSQKEQELLANHQSMSSEQLRGAVGELASLRTALTLPTTMVADVEQQESMETDDDDRQPEERQ